MPRKLGLKRLQPERRQDGYGHHTNIHKKNHYNKKQKNVDYDVFNVWIFVYESVEIALSTVLEC